MTDSGTVHLAVYDTLADWEPGLAIAHLNQPNWHRRPGHFRVRTVGHSLDPVTTLGGVRILPDVVLADLRPEDSAMLILPGNEIFAGPVFTAFATKAGEFLAAGVPVAAICGATGGLALAGLLDDRAHTSNAREFLDGLGYRGSAGYRDEAAVTDGDLITAGGIDSVDFARAILDRLEVMEPATLGSWYKLYGRHDPAGFYELMAS